MSAMSLVTSIDEKNTHIIKNSESKGRFRILEKTFIIGENMFSLLKPDKTKSIAKSEIIVWQFTFLIMLGLSLANTNATRATIREIENISSDFRKPINLFFKL